LCLLFLADTPNVESRTKNHRKQDEHRDHHDERIPNLLKHRRPPLREVKGRDESNLMDHHAPGQDFSNLQATSLQKIASIALVSILSETTLFSVSTTTQSAITQAAARFPCSSTTAMCVRGQGQRLCAADQFLNGLH
jgi:hypothetical protein